MQEKRQQVELDRIKREEFVQQCARKEQAERQAVLKARERAHAGPKCDKWCTVPCERNDVSHCVQEREVCVGSEARHSC